jgi:hypothetical protein
MVDYVADWARDVYRPAVLTELRVLASPEAEVATVFPDTGIISSRENMGHLTHGLKPASRTISLPFSAV